MYARQNNIKITFPAVIDGVRIKSVQWLSGQTDKWRSDNGITLHDDAVMPKYDRLTQSRPQLGDDGEYLPPEDLPFEQATANVIADYDARIEQRLNAEAQSRTYNSIDSIAKYQGYDNKFRLEAEALGAWVADTWDTAHAILNEWQASQATDNPQPIPTWDEIETQLPAAPAIEDAA
ncbi:hypothetical protein [Methylophaga sp. OBS4]|uniref:hypothetical protein n=1 Tax=Methylophaga sp. OBS4 TaxID=2991935 RepID=UPI002254DD7C|nr:hypothetical protein [Methylophaga sp. OBS4]MCX4186782.1 hypothetical protein [Methylophaga sp. OBS4]